MAGTVRFAVTRYGLAAAVQWVVPAGSVPDTLVLVDGSRQMSIVVRPTSTPLPFSACTRTRLIPVLRLIVGAVQDAVQAVHVAACPLTNTERVLIASAVPEMAAGGGGRRADSRW